MPLRIERRLYWMGLIAWPAAFWLVEKASHHIDGPAEWLLMTAWALAGVPLMCARLVDAAAPWVLGLIPIPLSIGALGAAGAIFLQKNLNADGVQDAAWMSPAIFAFVALALLALVVAPIVIGLLPSGPRSTSPAPDA